MSIIKLEVNLSHVDVSKLETDEDFRREAHRLLPNVLTQMGEQAGAITWVQLQKGLKRIPGMKVNSSSIEKQKFLREAGENHRQKASSSEQLEIEGILIEKLKAMKPKPR
jgi:hypothetical protein